MLVNRRVKLRSDQYAVSRLHAWRIGTDRQAPGQLNLKLNFATLIQVPEETVIIIPYCGEKEITKRRERRTSQ